MSVALEYKIIEILRGFVWEEVAALQQHFPIQILLTFMTFKLPLNFIFQCYIPFNYLSHYVVLFSIVVTNYPLKWCLGCFLDVSFSA